MRTWWLSAHLIFLTTIQFISPFHSLYNTIDIYNNNTLLFYIEPMSVLQMLGCESTSLTTAVH